MLALLEVELTLFLPNSVEFGRLPRRFALLEVELALFLLSFVELRCLPKMLELPVPMRTHRVSSLTQ
jgi:hypothetical protein